MRFLLNTSEGAPLVSTILLVIFFLMFVGLVIWGFGARAKKIYSHLESLPLNDEPDEISKTQNFSKRN